MLKELTQGTDNKVFNWQIPGPICVPSTNSDQDLATYINDYTANLALESQIL